MASGFTGYQVIQSLKRAYPHLAQGLTHLQVAGFTGGQILGALKRAKGQKVSDEEMFEDTQTEHEKTMEGDRRNKRKAKRQALGIAATAATLPFIGLKAYQALKAGHSAMTVLPALGGRQAAQGAGATLNVFQKGLPNLQKQIPYQQGQLPFNRGQIPHFPGQPPSPQAPIQPAAPQAPMGDYMQSVNVVKNMRANTLFENILKQGFDIDTASDLIRSIIKGDKRGSIGVFDKVPGGLDKVVADYSQYLQENPPEPSPFQQARMQEQQAPQMQPEPMQEPQAPIEAAQPQIGPGRQRLQELMERSRQARQPQAPVAPSQPVAPIEVEAIQKPTKAKTIKPKKLSKNKTLLKKLKEARDAIKGKSEDSKKKRDQLTKKIDELERA